MQGETMKLFITSLRNEKEIHKFLHFRFFGIWVTFFDS